MDSVLVLCEDSYYVVQYDELLDCIVDIQQVPLADITRIEFGQLEAGVENLPANSSTFSLGFLGGSSQKLKEGGHQLSPHCVRFQYSGGGGDLPKESGCHTFRSTGFRFFNNVAIPLSTEEERVESLKTVADSVAVAMEAVGLMPDMWFGGLERRKGPVLPVTEPSVVDEMQPGMSATGTSESLRTGKLRNVGVAAAISNVTSQISRFNPIGKLMRPPSTSASSEIRFTDLQTSGVNESQSSSCDEFLGAVSGPNVQHVDRMSALYSPSNVPPSIQISSNNSGDSHQYSLTTSDVRRRRKISRSSENLTDDHPIDNVLMPFAMLSQGLQSLGSNLVDNKLSRSCEHFMGLDLASGGKGPDLEDGGSGGHERSTAVDSRLLHAAKSPACQSLVLNI